MCVCVCVCVKMKNEISKKEVNIKCKVDVYRSFSPERKFWI